VQEFADPRVSVKEDVEFLKENPLIHPDSKSRISGWYYSVRPDVVLRLEERVLTSRGCVVRRSRTASWRGCVEAGKGVDVVCRCM
jgi:hypothetical protein